MNPSAQEEKVIFTIDALNPETGRKDGFQYTFGNTHVAQALACYAHAAGKLNQTKKMVETYDNGLRLLGEIPLDNPTRNTLFRVWKAHWDLQFKQVLQGTAQTYLLNLTASKYRFHLNQEQE